MEDMAVRLDELKQWAHDIRQRANQTERELAEIRLHGSAGDKAVNVTVTGHGKVVAVEISPGFLAGSSDQELGRYILAAIADARGQVDALIMERLAALGIDGNAISEALPMGSGRAAGSCSRPHQ